MCGIAGIVAPDLNSERRAEILASMTKAIAHRGPDDSGSFFADSVALGHRRLSILDLSSEGHQPMTSASKRFTIIFNGEIYNFQEIKNELLHLGHQFRGGSDTEVMLSAFEAWGIEASLSRFNGMFAFAVLDAQTQTLTLARDRLGKKPLYYGLLGTNFIFGSELKCFRAIPGFSFSNVFPEALTCLLHYGYIPAPYSILENIFKLPPGTSLSLPVKALEERTLQLSPFPEPIVIHSAHSFTAQPKRFWSLTALSKIWDQSQFRNSQNPPLNQLKSLLSDAVKSRMISDVPLGAFLSGGIDSSLIVALMQSQSSTPVRTFTIGFDQADYNESEHAKAVAAHLQTDHTALLLTGKDALDVIPSLPEMYDEPLADPSSIPTYLVSKLARKSVTVALSGDGGDELFGGYNRYFWPERIFSRISFLGAVGRQTLGKSLETLFPVFRHQTVEKLLLMAANRAQVGRPIERIEKLIEVLCASDLDDLYYRLMGTWGNGVPVKGHPNVRGVKSQVELNDFSGIREFPSRAMYFDQAVYLSDDLLAKVDRASMAVSLEARAPFLDMRVVEFANRLPLGVKAPKGEKKWMLRELLYTLIPKELVDRPKMGFSVPIGTWLNGPLKDWASELLSQENLQSDLLLEVSPIRQRWREHQSGARNWQLSLWSVLTYLAWKKHWGAS